MSNYWLDPHGYLYLADYTGTHEFIEIKEGDPGYNEKIAFLNFKYLPNGKNGRMKPCLHTGYVRIYPSEWNKGYDSWPELGIFFKYGRLVDYEEIQPDRL